MVDEPTDEEFLDELRTWLHEHLVGEFKAVGPIGVSGAAVEELNAQRIADQEAQLDRLNRQRDQLLQRAEGVRPQMEVIGADGVPVGTVDRVEHGRIKLVRADGGEGRHKGHHHFIELGLVAGVEGQKVRLSANAAVAVSLEEERSGKPT